MPPVTDITSYSKYRICTEFPSATALFCTNSFNTTTFQGGAGGGSFIEEEPEGMEVNKFSKVTHLAKRAVRI